MERKKFIQPRIVKYESVSLESSLCAASGQAQTNSIAIDATKEVQSGWAKGFSFEFE